MVQRLAFALCLLLTDTVAHSAETITVDIHDGLAFGSSRMRSMGGAFTAVAEGAGGHLFNAATMVNQPRGVTRSPVRLGLDFGYAQSMIRYAFPGDNALDPVQNHSLPAYTGFASAHLHSGSHAAGGTVETQGFRFASSPESYLLLNHHQIAVGYAHAFMDERLLVGLLGDLHIGTVTRYTFAEASPSQRAFFPSAQLGLLINVTDDTRVGWTLVPSFSADLKSTATSDEPTLALRQPLTTTFGICHQLEWNVIESGSYRDRRTAVFAADVVYLGASRGAFSASPYQPGVHRIERGGPESFASSRRRDRVRARLAPTPRRRLHRACTLCLRDPKSTLYGWRTTANVQLSERLSMGCCRRHGHRTGLRRHQCRHQLLVA